MARDFKKEYREFHGKPEQIANRSSRNSARRQMEAKLGEKALKGKDVDHRDGNPRNNSAKNLRVEKPGTNRGRK